jgi:hypothetical protein
MELKPELQVGLMQVAAKWSLTITTQKYPKINMNDPIKEGQFIRELVKTYDNISSLLLERE